VTKHLYAVQIKGGRSNKKWQKFFNNVTPLNAKPPDVTGIDAECVISHHMDSITIHCLATDGFRKGEGDVTVNEITKDTLSNRHAHLGELVEKYFLPYGVYPNISP
jgi:hypothetical protein